MHFILFGLGFIYTQQFLHQINFIFSTVLFLVITISLLPKEIAINDVYWLNKLKYKMLLLGPVLYLIIMLNMGFPLLHNNTNIHRIIVRDSFFIDFVALPATNLFLISTYIKGYKRNKLEFYFSIFFVSFIGYLSGFRAATVTPFILYIVFLFVTKKIRFNIKSIVLLLTVIFASLELLILITKSRVADNSDVLSQLAYRIFRENSSLNWDRYISYLNENGLMLGSTYVRDALSVIRLVDFSFQELLSGGGKLVMNTPFYAEIFLNFGWMSAFMAQLIGMLFGLFLVFWSKIFKRNGVFITYVFLFVLPSVLQAGITKYSFVAIPKVIFILILFHVTNVKTKKIQVNSCNE